MWLYDVILNSIKCILVEKKCNIGTIMRANVLNKNN